MLQAKMVAQQDKFVFCIHLKAQLGTVGLFLFINQINFNIMSNQVWNHKTQFENSTIVTQEYFAGVSNDAVMKTITHTYFNNINEIKGQVEAYVGHHIPETHDSKI